MTINVYDEFFSEEDHQFIFNYCENASYFYGEKDKEYDGPYYENYEKDLAKYCTGLVHEVYFYRDELNELPSYEEVYLPGGGCNKFINQRKFFDLFTLAIENRFPIYKQKDVTRVYINCFAPLENPYFHTDGDIGTTFLYYPNKRWELDEGGETQFFIDNSIYGVPPIPNRLIYFDANLLHRATSFRSSHRFSIAVKYQMHESPNWKD
jgi:hypothetical protein